MVSAATNSIISSGIHSNNARTSATPRAKNESTQKKTKSVSTRKTPTKISAIGEPKYSLSSLPAIERIFFIAAS